MRLLALAMLALVDHEALIRISSGPTSSMLGPWGKGCTLEALAALQAAPSWDCL